MEINHRHEQENSTMVIGLGHVILVFAMLFGCLAFSMLTLLCESLWWKAIRLGGLKQLYSPQD